VVGSQSIRRRRAWGRTEPPGRRIAYTLVELLIVVALLSVILTLTLPSLRQLSAKSELRDAARQLRVALLEARLAAIESGSLTYFRYQTGGGRFEVGRAAAPPQSGGPPADADRAAQGDADLESTAQPRWLPLGMRFVDPVDDRPIEPPAAADEEEAAGDASWSAPILFFPNGRTLDARIALRTASHRIELQIRGLTGTVQVSRAERLLPPETAAPAEVRGVRRAQGAAS